MRALVAMGAHEKVVASVSRLLDCSCWPREYLRYFKLQPIKKHASLTNVSIFDGLTEYFGREFAVQLQLIICRLPHEQQSPDKQQFSPARRFSQSVVMKFPDIFGVNEAMEACQLLAKLYLKDSGKQLDAAKVINHFIGRLSAHFSPPNTAPGLAMTTTTGTTTDRFHQMAVNVDLVQWIRLLVDFARYIALGGGSKKHIALIIEEAKTLALSVNCLHLIGMISSIEREFGVANI